MTGRWKTHGKLLDAAETRGASGAKLDALDERLRDLEDNLFRDLFGPGLDSSPMLAGKPNRLEDTDVLVEALYHGATVGQLMALRWNVDSHDRFEEVFGSDERAFPEPAESPLAAAFATVRRAVGIRIVRVRESRRVGRQKQRGKRVKADFRRKVKAATGAAVAAKVRIAPA